MWRGADDTAGWWRQGVPGTPGSRGGEGPSLCSGCVISSCLPLAACHWAWEGGTRWDLRTLLSAPPLGGGAPSEHLLPFPIPPECGATQPQPTQVLRARGERQGCRVDCGRAGVPETKTAKDDGVCGPPPHTSPGRLPAQSLATVEGGRGEMRGPGGPRV